MKTLVIILSETRAFELTFNNFKENVIDVLDADLALCIGVKQDYNYENPFYKLAKYHFLYDEENDKTFAKSIEYSYNQTNNLNLFEKLENIHFFGDLQYIGSYNEINNDILCKYTDNHIMVYKNNNLYSINNNTNNTYYNDINTITYIKKKHYMDFLDIKDKIQSENNDPTHFSNFLISTYIHIFFLWFLQINIIKHNLLDIYDRFIITRSDYIYQLPFPNLSILNEKYIWIPNSEDYDGLCDRLVVLSKNNIINYINILENFYIKSNKYYLNIKNRNNWNMEQILKMHLEENNISHLVKRIPYISYTVRNITGTTRWHAGIYSEKLGYYIKYPSEYDISSQYKNKLNEHINNFYKMEINNINKQTIENFNNVNNNQYFIIIIVLLVIITSLIFIYKISNISTKNAKP